MKAMPRIRRRHVDPALETALPVDLHPVLRRVYAARGISGPAELDYGLDALHPPDLLGGLDEAAALLEEILTAGGRILVVGDFDADGATGTAVAVRALGAMGARVEHRVPDRFRLGYGLSPELVEQLQPLDPALILTVDNGISSLQGVRAARQAGIRVLVTDHHLPGRELPPADAIVNPNLPGDIFPSKALAGVGVVFYLMTGLRARLREHGWFAGRGLAEPRLAELLDLVALGTVADVVPLDRNNRALVQQGLRRIRAGRGSPGVQALLRVAGRDPGRCLTTDLGFAVGPRLNAAGRLEDMSLGIECLITDSPDRAQALAAELDGLNRQRREIEGRMTEQALVQLEPLAAELSQGNGDPAVCLFDPDWHQGVIGILASRLKDRLHRPVVAFAPAEPGWVKGSARSVPGLHVRDALARVEAGRPGLIARFGGHAMAAGISLREADLPLFREAFGAAVEEVLGPRPEEPELLTDGALQAADFQPGLAAALQAGGPWGQSFPAPLFDNAFRVCRRRVVGERHLQLGLQCPEGGAVLPAIAFNALERGWDRAPAAVRAAFRLELNCYRGEERLQLVVEALEPA